MLLINSTISGNTSNSNVGGSGGLYNNGTMTVANSTISGNSAPTGNNNGGGFRSELGNTTITNSTIANNSAAGANSAGGVFRSDGTVTIRSSIIAGNNNATQPDVVASGGTGITSSGFNLIGNRGTVAFGGTSDQAGGNGNPILNPLLGALQNNGGPTLTHALLFGSTALDAGTGSGLATDQRGSGFNRIVDLSGNMARFDDGADIGAYEAQSAPAVQPVVQFSAASYSVGEAAGSVTITVTRTGSTSGASTVDFATGNNAYVPCNTLTGSAVQNCDFIVSTGTLTFAAGDSSKTFDILITDDAWLEGNETLPVTLTNPVAATLGSTSSATVTILDSEGGGTTSPIAKQFVANLTGGQETPANNSTAKGGGVVLLNTAETSAQVSLIFSGLSSAQTTAKIHGPGAAGVAAPPIFTLANGTVQNSLINPSTQQVGDLKAGLHYLNVSSANFTSGEIRGQLLWNPLEETPFFVLQHYYDFLQRLPDAGGYSFWQSLMTICGSDVQCLRDRRLIVSNAFFYEQEYQQTGAYVFRLYRAAYGNHQPFPNPDNSNPTESLKLPSYAVFAADRARVVGGASLAQGQSDLANAFVTRPEFVAKYAPSLTGPQFVDAVLATLQTELGVDLSAERTNLINLFNSGGRGAVLYRLADDNAQNPISNSTFINEEYNRAFVATQYFGYLRRDADIGGFLFWLGQVNSGPLRDVNKQHAMVCSFNTSGEYQLRFGPVITRFNSECQ